MPKDVPPRPGAPGYDEFIAHQQRQDAAAGGTAAPGAGAPVATGTTPTTAAAEGGAPQQLAPAYARPNDRSTTQGGLY